jgi:hypothetical protein
MVAVLASAVACGGLSEVRPEVERCMEQARAHYRSIGAYPVFPDGIDAEHVAREHCERSPKAFDNVG